MNEQLIKRLREIATLYSKLDDNFRTRAYRRAITSLEDVGIEIVNSKQLQGLKGFGKSILEDIDQWLDHRTIYRLVALKSGDAVKGKDPRSIAILNLTSIAGIGPKKATDLVDNHQIFDVEQLRQAHLKKEVRLSKAQSLTLHHYYDLQRRIPHEEMKAWMVALGEVIKRTDPDLIWEGVGSYRRHQSLPLKDQKHATSGDIDLLVHCKGLMTRQDVEGSDVIRRITKTLSDTVVWVDALSKGKKKLAALVCLPGRPTRHLDVRLFPHSSIALARLHFTGSAQTNAMMRGIARQKKMKLNEYSLLDSDGVAIPIKTERDVFKHLSIDYIAPEKR